MGVIFKNDVSYSSIPSSSNILNTVEEIEDNADESKIAGALAVKELSANLAYKDITDKFTVDESKLKISAYVENRMVFVNARVLANSNGSITAKLNDLIYAPRVISAGVYMPVGSSADKGKFVGGYISSTGDLLIWLDSALSTAENVVFTYPLKTDL